MKKIFLYLPALFLLLFTACKQAVKPEDLYGKWKYVKLENPNSNPPHIEPDWKLKMEQPYIEFTKNNDLVMYWNKEVLAHGKFRTDGDKIQFKEVLAGGQTREFPFYVTEFKDNTMIFETRGEDATRVTVVKQ
ncbi:MAG TPA: hypothetical protein VGC01_04890 [Mucilaginibacter sp.]